MNQVEIELLTALYLLYAFECVQWVAAGSALFTRTKATQWTLHCVGKMSFTLLGRMPVLTDPFLLRPGLVRVSADVAETPATERALHRTAIRLNQYWLLEMQCRVQAMLLTIYVPAILALHLLTLLWPRLLVVLLTSHVLLMVSYALALRRWQPAKVLATMAPMLVNPLGAIRLMDAFAQVLFACAGPEKRKRKKRAK